MTKPCATCSHPKGFHDWDGHTNTELRGVAGRRGDGECRQCGCPEWTEKPKPEAPESEIEKAFRELAQVIHNRATHGKGGNPNRTLLEIVDAITEVLNESK